jgi:hypothetical protein
MPPTPNAAREERQRNLLYLSTPSLWPVYPFLPVIRCAGGIRFGLLCDVKGVYGLYGFGSTVFLTNLHRLPQTLPEFLALPKCVFDSSEEVYDAGWRVD